MGSGEGGQWGTGEGGWGGTGGEHARQPRPPRNGFTLQYPSGFTHQTLSGFAPKRLSAIWMSTARQDTVTAGEARATATEERP